MIHCGESISMMASQSQVNCLSTHDKPRLVGVASHLFSRWYICFMVFVICSKISVDMTNDQRLDITYIYV